MTAWILLTLLTAAPGGEPPTRTSPPIGEVLALDAARSSVRYHLHHRMHDVDGRATTLEGKAVIAPDGEVRAMFRIPVASLDSGDANRDAHTREVLEAGKYPFVVFKGTTRVATPLRPGTAKVDIAGELDLHGNKRPMSLPAEITFSEGAVALRATMQVSLDEFRVDRPALLLVKVDDRCLVDVDLMLREVKP
jgi:polyisoprenoid-binding protein YceI